MKTLLKRIPWFYGFFTVYPLLYLWRVNALEISPVVILRPFLFTLIGSAILYFVLIFIFRDHSKAAWCGALILLLFFSYGQVYGVIRQSSLEAFGRHRVLVLVYLLIFGLGMWGILSHIKKLKPFVHWLTILSGVLVLIPVVQLGYYYFSTAIAAQKSTSSRTEPLATTQHDLPDVYYIIMDSYMRSDALQQEMGFDNSAFIDQLTELGFYVAQCSRSNYTSTRISITTALNLKYLPELEAESGLSADDDTIWALIPNNEVRHQLEQYGYKTVAFRSEYPWLEWADATLFLGLSEPSIDSKYLYPFEYLYLKSTAGVLGAAIDKDDIIKFLQLSSSDQELPSTLDPYLQRHVASQLYIIEKMFEIPTIPGPKFVYTHFMIPHGPYVFGPQGELIPMPVEPSNDSSDPSDTPENREGYINGVQFINGQIIPILENIINNSPYPPIIILQGDHGYRNGKPGENTILNAYYLPDGHADLYPSITPVNSFRIVMNHYFGTEYSLLPDESGTMAETYPDCMP